MSISYRFRQAIFIIALIVGVIGLNQVLADVPKVAIASAHPLATDAGLAAIQQGGNVFDAAVAVSAALAVVEPASSGLGGGGYWLLHRESDHRDIFIDGREKAPLAAHKNMYLDKNGKVVPNLSLDGALAAAIPGMPAALVHLAETYGKLPLAQSLKPAISYARNGFAITPRYLKLLELRRGLLQQHAESSRIFLVNGKAPRLFSIIKQPDLADTLEHIAKDGHAGFYDGEVADKLVNGVRQLGGIWTKEDLKQYRVVERTPLTGEYRGIRVTGAPPSSSGGTVLLETLNMLSGYDLARVDAITRKHLIAEAMRRAYHDRALYLGDSDFISVPIQRLTNLDYAAGLRASIHPEKALPSDFLAPSPEESPQGPQTTHFSIIDNEGNRVAATLSINMVYGAGVVPKGTGVILNDEMDDFASAIGVLNGYGLTGGAANAIAPGKRMLSSMSPTFLETGDRIAALGTPGGSKIISMVLHGVLDFAQGNNPPSWVKVPRFHHQYLPDVIEYETGALTGDEIAALGRMGHRLKEVIPYGDMQAVQLDKRTRSLSAASDPRGEGKAVAVP